MLKIRVLSDEKSYKSAEVSEAANNFIKSLNSYPKGWSDNFSKDAIVCFVNVEKDLLAELEEKEIIKKSEGMYEYIRLLED